MNERKRRYNQMVYKRPNIARPDKPHPIQDSYGMYGQINVEKDSPWLIPHLSDVMDKGYVALRQLQDAIERVKKMNLDEYRPEVALAKRTEPILKARRDVLASVKRAIEKASSNANAATADIMRPTEPVKPSDPMKAMLLEMRHSEIRGLVRGMDPRLRKEFVRGNLERIQALVNSPDEILSSDTLNELRREYVLKDDPTLADFEADQKLIYKATRKRAGDITATALGLLQVAREDHPEIPNVDIPPTEHFEVFPPETEYQKYLAAEKLEAWTKKEIHEAIKKEQAEEDEGVNLEAGHRAVRIDRGIQHQ
jgi:hypothetical protein